MSTVLDGLIFSKNSPPRLRGRVENLLANGWTAADTMCLSRTYDFDSLEKKASFKGKVDLESEKRNHHPKWITEDTDEKEIIVEWSTHRPRGLSTKDAEMAEFCDKTAQEYKSDV